MLSTLTTGRQAGQPQLINWTPTGEQLSNTQVAGTTFPPLPLPFPSSLLTVMTTCCSCGKAIKVIAKRFSANRFAAFTFLPHIISGRCLVYSKLRKRVGGGCRGRWQAGNGWQKPKHSYDKASRRHIIKKPCLKLQQLEATLQQLLMNEWQYKWRGGVQKYGIADWTQREGEGERGDTN